MTIHWIDIEANHSSVCVVHCFSASISLATQGPIHCATCSLAKVVKRQGIAQSSRLPQLLTSPLVHHVPNYTVEVNFPLAPLVQPQPCADL